MILDFLNTLIIVGIVFILIGISLIINSFIKNEYLYEKISLYECGFDAFSEARDPFDVKFYFIAILFIIFDIEILFFFPWVLAINELFIYGLLIKIIFILILIIGFGYEYKKQCMDFIQKNEFLFNDTFNFSHKWFNRNFFRKKKLNIDININRINFIRYNITLYFNRLV